MTENKCKYCKTGRIAGVVCTYSAIVKEYKNICGVHHTDIVPPCPFTDEHARIYCTRYTEKPPERYEVIIIPEIQGAVARIIHVCEADDEAQRFIRNKIRVRRVDI